MRERIARLSRTQFTFQSPSIWGDSAPADPMRR